jgi:hypothetical protein
MSKRYEASNGTPMDLRVLWDMNGTSFELAERAYRAWLAGAGRIQNEAIGFLNGRFEKNLETARQLSNCKTASDYFEVQAKYADVAMSDYIAQSQKLVQLFGELTKETTQPLEEAADETTRRVHRAAGRASH